MLISFSVSVHLPFSALGQWSDPLKRKPTTVHGSSFRQYTLLKRIQEIALNELYIKLGKHWRRLGESGAERAPKRDEASRKLTEREMNASGHAKHESAAKWDRPQSPRRPLEGGYGGVGGRKGGDSESPLVL